jgi:hypothetical protein
MPPIHYAHATNNRFAWIFREITKQDGEETVWIFHVDEISRVPPDKVPGHKERPTVPLADLGFENPSNKSERCLA